VYVTYKRRRKAYSTADVYVTSTLHDITNAEDYSLDPQRKTAERRLGKRHVEVYMQEKSL
jgi:hypothetical protein